MSARLTFPPGVVLDTRMTLFRSIALPLVALLALAAAGACAGTRPASAIHKIQMHHLKSDRPPQGADPMILSEHRKRLHGAVTAEERRDRLGNYYTVHWSVPQGTGPVTVRFEYQVANAADRTRTREVVVPSPSGRQVTQFEVTGREYANDGRVIAWRISLLEGDRPIAVETSYLWN